jgi:hypothetical protein
MPFLRNSGKTFLICNYKYGVPAGLNKMIEDELAHFYTVTQFF